MHVEHNFFNIVFHFTLFGLLIYKFVMLGKTYLVPFLRKQLHHLEKEKMILFEKRELLQSTLKRVQNSITQQESSFSTLETKVHVWHQYIKNECKKQGKRAERIEKCMIQKQLQQNTYLANSRDMISVLDEAELSACNQLSKEFTGIDGKKTLGLFIKKLQMSKQIE